MELPWSGRAGAGVCGGETGGSLSHSGMGMGCFVSAGFKVWAIRVLFHVYKSDDTSPLYYSYSSDISVIYIVRADTPLVGSRFFAGIFALIYRGGRRILESGGVSIQTAEASSS